MTVLTETRHTAEFVVSCANLTRSVDKGIVAASENLQAGQVVATNGGKYVAYDSAGGPPVDVATGILWEATGGALAADKEMTVLTRDAEVNGAELTVVGDSAAAAASLLLLGIIVR